MKTLYQKELRQPLSRFDVSVCVKVSRASMHQPRWLGAFGVHQPPLNLLVSLYLLLHLRIRCSVRCEYPQSAGCSHPHSMGGSRWIGCTRQVLRFARRALPVCLMVSSCEHTMFVLTQSDYGLVRGALCIRGNVFPCASDTVGRTPPLGLVMYSQMRLLNCLMSWSCPPHGRYFIITRTCRFFPSIVCGVDFIHARPLHTNSECDQHAQQGYLRTTSEKREGTGFQKPWCASVVRV